MLQLPAVRYAIDRNRITLEIPANMRQHLMTLAKQCSAGYMRVELARPSKPRTTGEGGQGHHINGHVQQIAQETGNDFADVKSAAKHEAISRGYPFRTIAGQVIPHSESEIDTIAAGHLIDALHQIAAELSITLKEE